MKKGSELNKTLDETLKGKELKMPNELFFLDKDGAKRSHIRIKWWEDPSQMTYKSICVEPLDMLPDQAIDKIYLLSTEFYDDVEKPVFFGDYWLKGQPSLYKNTVCCLDYSVAKQGKLVAYRFNNESILKDENFVYV